MGVPRRLPMQKRESREKLNVTFTKRRAGLFHKAAELSRLCDAQVAVLVSSPNGKYYYSFAPTSVDAVLDAFLTGRAPEPVSAGVAREAHRLAGDVEKLEGALRCAKEVWKGGGCPWEALRRYEESATTAEELRALYDSLSELKAKYDARAAYSCTGSSEVAGSPVTDGGAISQSDVSKQVAAPTLAYGYDMAGNWYLSNGN